MCVCVVSHCISIHLIDGHLDCSHILTVINTAAVNIGVNVSF